ncbi:hypothetical protein HID58_013213 [Brassica napus]|uniref:Uncharacterized protein n=1 Tax=Brassica napus TaxID=3708 RepID=A0ABQ8E623_BRANA|nr:hypothetical protein HID58_013213 [Brassica napus]
MTLLEGGGKRPCCVPFIADLVVGRGYRLVFSDLQGGGAMSYGVGDVQRLPKSGMHPFGSVTNGLVDRYNIDPSCRVMKSQWRLSCVWRAMCSNGKSRSLACTYF